MTVLNSAPNASAGTEDDINCGGLLYQDYLNPDADLSCEHGKEISLSLSNLQDQAIG
jgi:hypothetical protein